jgi:superfamily II DNA or RNA helicase
MIEIEPINETFVKINTSYDILMELKDTFTYIVPGHKFMPKFKAGIWDGTISMINIRNAQVMKGLIPDILQWAIDREYNITVNKEIVAPFKENIDFDFDDFKLPFTPHDFQEKGMEITAKKKRGVLLSATGSGKSLIIYGQARLMMDALEEHEKVLIMVPYLSLVDQLAGDFIDYSKNNGWDVMANVHRIPTDNKLDPTGKRIILTTWQSMQHKPKEYFQQFGGIICDEVHTYYQKASDLKVCSAIINSCTNAFFRFGLSGTIDDGAVVAMQLKGMFGPVRRISDTKDLIDRNILSDLKVVALTLKYPEEESKVVRKLHKKYNEEVDWIIQHPRRAKFIENLAVTRTGNTLMLFQFVKKHGKPMFETIKKRGEELGKQVYLVYGGTAADQRNKIRAIAESHNNVIIIASYPTFATGVNIVNLNNIIFTSPTKAKIRVLQTVGRVLRKGEDKDIATVYDLGDDIRGKTKTNNYALNHYIERYNIYINEGFVVEVKEINI